MEKNERKILTVNSEGLKPHLQLIWLGILEAMQKEVNSQGGFTPIEIPDYLKKYTESFLN